MAGKKPVGADKKEQNKPASKTVKKKPTGRKQSTKTKNIKKSNSNKEEQSSVLNKKPERKYYDNKLKCTTHTGYKLTPRQAKFVQLYVETGNGSQSVIDAGFKQKNPRHYGQYLLTKPAIADEISYRLQQFEQASIASAQEVMEFYTKVMRGQVKDQFELDAPLSERIKAGNELAKRLVDIPNRLEGRGQATVTIALDWTGMEESKENTDDEQGEIGKT